MGLRLRSSIPYIIFINIVVFLAWNVFGERDFMAEHFLVSWTGLAEGRYWILITSVFSHSMFLHLFMNMYVLHSFGPIMEETLGVWRFLRFYFFAGVVSSFCHAFVSAYLLHEPSLPALGASGAISGLILLFCLLFPREKIILIFIPLPALWGAAVFVGLDIWGLSSQAAGGGLPIGHGAHLGGALVGLIYFLFFFGRRANR